MEEALENQGPSWPYRKVKMKIKTLLRYNKLNLAKERHTLRAISQIVVLPANKHKITLTFLPFQSNVSNPDSSHDINNLKYTRKKKKVQNCTLTNLIIFSITNRSSSEVIGTSLIQRMNKNKLSETYAYLQLLKI